MTGAINLLEVMLVGHALLDADAIPVERCLLVTPACACALSWIDLHPTEARYAPGFIAHDVFLALSNPDARPVDDFEELLIGGTAKADDVVALVRRAEHLSAVTFAGWPAPLVLEMLCDKPSNRPRAA
jgi:hypothetical protein